MVLAETAMAAVLLAGTGLMTRSFQALVDTDPGFDSADEWALRFQINAAEGPAQLAEDRQRLLDIARDVPGVLSVGGSKTPLLDGGGAKPMVSPSTARPESPCR